MKMEKKNLNNIIFIDTSTEVKTTLEKLSKTALRAGGKVIAPKIKDNTRARTQRLKNHVGYWARINKQTGQPELQIGYYSWQRVKKRGKQPSHANPSWIEHGTLSHKIQIKNAKTLTDGKIDFGKSVIVKGMNADHTLRTTVLENIDEMRKAQEEYLNELNQEIEKAQTKIHEGEEEEFV